MNLLLAGRDTIALDRVRAELFGIPIERIKSLKIAGDRNLRCKQIEEIEILPNIDMLHEKKLDLNDTFEEIKELEMPNNFRILKVNNYKG
jgi:uncharacterized protein (DUF362 family)